MSLFYRLCCWSRCYGVWEATLPGSPFDYWLWTAGVPTAIFLTLNSRRLRAVGPIVYAATLIAISGLGAAFLFAMNQYLNIAGPIHFVREDLARLPIMEAIEIYRAEVQRLSASETLTVLTEFLQNPWSVMVFANSEAINAFTDTQIFAFCIAGIALGVALAWMYLRRLAKRHQDRKTSERMLAVDVLMTIFALPQFLIWISQKQWFAASGIALGVLAYKLILRWRLSDRSRAIHTNDSHTLLMLRVFGFERRSQKLLEQIEDRWRFLGPIRLLGAADLAHSIIEPNAFYAFLNRKLNDEFVKSQADLDRRTDGSPVEQEPDGTYRLENFYCHADTWRMAVAHLRNRRIRFSWISEASAQVIRVVYLRLNNWSPWFL